MRALSLGATLMALTTLEIAGMHAVHAVRAVHTALAGVPGITRADVSLGRAAIEHDGRATVERLGAAVREAGFEVVRATEDRRTLLVSSTGKAVE